VTEVEKEGGGVTEVEKEGGGVTEVEKEGGGVTEVEKEGGAVTEGVPGIASGTGGASSDSGTGGATGGADTITNTNSETPLAETQKVDQDLREAFHDGNKVMKVVTFLSKTYTLWWPKSKSLRATSPFTYISDHQRTELLHRSVPVAAVMQRAGRKIIRLFVIFTGLLDEDGKLVGYLMGLYKFKCNSTPIMSAVYCLIFKEIIVLNSINDLKAYTCDVTVTPSQEAIDAHNEYYESKRWREEGVFESDTGIVRDNRCIHFNATKMSLPSEEEPGKR
jgi:hypothetical protein